MRNKEIWASNFELSVINSGPEMLLAVCQIIAAHHDADTYTLLTIPTPKQLNHEEYDSLYPHQIEERNTQQVNAGQWLVLRWGNHVPGSTPLPYKLETAEEFRDFMWSMMKRLQSGNDHDGDGTHEQEGGWELVSRLPSVGTFYDVLAFRRVVTFYGK